MRVMKMNEDENFKERIIDQFKCFQMNLNKNIVVEIQKIRFIFLLLVYNSFVRRN